MDTLELMGESSDMPQPDSRNKVALSVKINAETYDDIERERKERGLSRSAIIQERLELGGRLGQNVRKILTIVRRLDSK